MFTSELMRFELPSCSDAVEVPLTGVPAPPATVPGHRHQQQQPAANRRAPWLRIGWACASGCRVLDCDNCDNCDTLDFIGLFCPQSVRSQCDNCGQICPGKSKGVRSFLALVSGASECRDLQRGNSSRTPPPTGGPHGSKGKGITYQH